MSESRPSVAVYLRHYLSPSETFVYRQLQGISHAFDPIVLTANPGNLDRFPTDPLCVARKGFFGKVYARIAGALAGRYTILTPAQRRTYEEALVRHNVQLIHAHFAHFALDLLPLARERNLPMLVTFHGFDASVMLSDQRYLKDLAGLVEYATTIMVSKNMVQRLAEVGIHARQPIVHYIGVPTDDFVYVDRHSIAEKMKAGVDISFLQVSNFVEVKGHRYTVEAFARFAADYPHCRLTLAGDGPTRHDIEALCRQFGIVNRVHFTGVVDKAGVVRLMREADVFLQHSVTLPNGCKEGLPTVLMEAMATGLVVVASRHSGIPELIEDGVDGLLVEERDVDGYAERLKSLATVDAGIGRRARAKVDSRFNMLAQNEKLVEIYHRAIDGHEG